MLESWEDRRLIVRLVAEVVGDRGWSWVVVDDRASTISRSKLWDFKSQRDLTWSYDQCLIITAPIVHGRRPLIEEIAQLVVTLVEPPIVRHQYRFCHQSQPVPTYRTTLWLVVPPVFSLPIPIYMGWLVGCKSLGSTTPKGDTSPCQVVVYLIPVTDYYFVCRNLLFCIESIGIVAHLWNVPSGMSANKMSI